MNEYCGPHTARLNLADGSTIDCAIFEDPQRTVDGVTHYLLEPVRHLAPGERAVGFWLDVLPPKSTATLMWPDRPHHLRAGTAQVTWEDHLGRRDSSGPLVYGWQDPPQEG